MDKKVAPFAGAWIEIQERANRIEQNLIVAPFAGAWIEIPRRPRRICRGVRSLPSRERGLKSDWCALR